MSWQFIFTALSCALFFGFVVLCVKKYGLQSCYSAYGPLWAKEHKFNIWSAVTFVTAALLVPVAVEMASGSLWQFTGFLCPACILFVALTPDYGTNPVAGEVHMICAVTAALWAVLYILFVFPSFWWIIAVVLAAATIASLVTGFKEYWDFWYEMAAYAAMYSALFLAISKL